MAHEPHTIFIGNNVIYALELAASAEESSGILLIDAGPDSAGDGGQDTWAQAVSQASSYGFAPDDVRILLITHAHIDHAGLAHNWAQAGARVLVGPDDLATVRSGTLTRTSNSVARRDELRLHGCPDRFLNLTQINRIPTLRWEPCTDAESVQDGTTFTLGDGAQLRIIAAPGHTPGNLTAFVADSGDLYSGDTLLPDTFPTPGLHFPNVMAEPKTVRQTRWPSLPPFLDSVRQLSTLPVRRVFPGHGETVDEPTQLFTRFERHHERRARRIGTLLVQRPDSAYGIATRLFPHLPDARVSQAMTEIIGHLDLLLQSGTATVREDSDGILIFRN